MGSKILLPVDILFDPGIYAPPPDRPAHKADNPVYLDLVMVLEGWRRFTADEFRAGRLPLWYPSIFTGTPLAYYSIYAPLNFIYVAFPSPWTLAWIQLVKSLIAGLGAYYFFRRILGVGYWPALLGACCYPITGFFILWQGYQLTHVMAWFPWMLAATDRTIQKPAGWGGPCLAVLTSVLLLSSQIDIACQVLLTCGLYALWRLFDCHGLRLTRRHLTAAGVCAAAWALGSVLSAPYLLPLADYLQTSARMRSRFQGMEERPPGGMEALPEILLPEFYGSTQAGSWRFKNVGNLLESSAAAYVGLLLTLVAAPIGLVQSRCRGRTLFWAFLGLFALSWTLDIPGLVWIFRLPFLNMMSGNRFVFVTAFAILTLAIIGLDVIRRGEFHWHGGLLVFPALLAGFGLLCLGLAFFLPEPLAFRAEIELEQHKANPFGIPSVEALRHIQDRYRRVYLTGAILCGLGIAGWTALAQVKPLPRWCLPLFGGLCLAELLVFAWNQNPQCDPSLYYPRVPALEQLAEGPPGRVLGILCLPPNLCEWAGLRDIRGYDGVDPAPLIEVLDLIRDERFPAPPTSTAQTRWFVPRNTEGSDGTTFIPPVLNMLSVRWFLLPEKFNFLDASFLKTARHQDGYWIVENPNALPRAYVPQQVETVSSSRRVLEKLAQKEFDPRRVAYVNRAIHLPEKCQGQARIAAEVPSEVTVAVQMETPGLLVLTDRWTPDWKAYLDGKETPVLQTNHLLRGVEVPAGDHTVVFRYEPWSFTLGVRLFLAASVVLLLWLALGALRWAGRDRPGGPDTAAMPKRSPG